MPASSPGQGGPRFRLLGPLEFRAGPEWTPVGAAKQRALLAVLLVNANRSVAAHKLVSELWGERPPASAAGLLAGYVWRLRRSLGDHNGRTLATRAPGYQLVVPAGAVDVHVYEALVAEGRRGLAAGDLAGGVAALTEAEGLWRGRPLADVAPAPSVLAEVARLEEARLADVEARIDAEIGLGRHESLLPELKQMVSQYPLRERLHAHLMVAMCRTGQQAEALGAYRDLRQLLVEELGIEPSKPLRELHRRILHEDPLLMATVADTARVTATPRPAVPRTLPPDVPVFVGRAEETTRLTARLAAGEQRCGVHGMAGAGKTSLAVHAAHRVAAHFPDGLVYLDLGASGARAPLRPAEAAARLLAVLGMPVGDQPDDATASLRTALVGRRILFVFDDVFDGAQVDRLLPTTPGCAVVIVGRPATTAVVGADLSRLGRLPAPAATELLRAYAGADRVATDPAAADRIARHCDYLPLALRIAATRLAQRPKWTVGEFAARLADPRRRLDALTRDGLSVRECLRAGVRLLGRAGDHDPARTLRLLGALDLPVVPATALAALLGVSERDADATAERLVDAGLVEALSIDQYRVPDLVRLFARDEYVPADEDHAATRRVVGHYEHAVRGHLAELADRRRGAGIAWYRGERAVLTALAARAGRTVLPNLLGELRTALRAGAGEPKHRR